MVNILAFCCVFTLSFVGSSYTTNVVATSRDCGGYMFVGDSVVIDGPFKKNCILKFKTQEDRILVFSLIDGNFKEAEQYFSIHDGIDGDSPILLVENQKLSQVSRKDLPASVYSTQSTASIQFKKTASANFKLKIQKAVNCPFNLGSASQCGRVVDQVSCYCATFIKRNQSDQTMFCVDNGMKLIAFESQAEEGLIQSTWDVVVVYWTSMTDIRREGTWVWESTWKFPSSYLHWSRGEPNNKNRTENCMVYGGHWKSAWNDLSCSYLAFAICEAQP